MKIATTQQIRNIDRRAIKEFGIPGMVLMENAATAVLAEMEHYFEGLAGVRVGIICGKGNNGGDGFALARRLRVRGAVVRVALLASFSEITGDARTNLATLRKTDIEILQKATQSSLADVIAWSEIVVDAMLGVGLSTPVKGLFAQAVDLINVSDRPVVSVDMPTGIDADTGEVRGTAIKADLTVTMGLLKRGLVLHPGAQYAGRVRVADLGIPGEVIEKERVTVSLLDRAAMGGILNPRVPDAHKGDFGHLMIVGGSPGKTGAAVMASRGALRSGTGLVSVAAPNGLVPLIQSQSSETMCIPAAESIEGTLGIGAEVELVKAAGRMSACVIGPGLSTHYETVQSVRNLVQGLSVPMVIDADGLNALAGHTDILKRSAATIILTPHSGEMGRLLGVPSGEVQKDRINISLEFAKKYKVTLVLKGANTVVATPQGWVFINSTGNPGMSTAGTGDVLSGMIGGLLAQGYTASQSACLGVYLHGLAGDLAEKEKGEMSMIAGDLIEQIPAAIKEIYNRN